MCDSLKVKLHQSTPKNLGGSNAHCHFSTRSLEFFAVFSLVKANGLVKKSEATKITKNKEPTFSGKRPFYPPFFLVEAFFRMLETLLGSKLRR